MGISAKIDRFVYGLAYFMAMLGGATLLALMTLTVVSVTGRGLVFLGLGPVPGDFELIEAGTAFAVFAFLPWCQLRRGHVTVDIFLSHAGPRTNRIVDLIANVTMTAAAAVILWRLFLGMQDKMSFGETTFIIQFPLWWSYAASVCGAAIFLLVAIWSVWRSSRELSRGGQPDNTGVGPI